jgi:hypothetical protein
MKYNFTDMLNTKMAKEYCKDHGVPLTSWGLFAAAQRMGFGRKKNKHWEFDVGGLWDYVTLRNSTPPKQWLPVLAIAEKFKVPKKFVYNLIVGKDVPSRYFLSEKKIFADPKSFGVALKAMRKEVRGRK